MTCHEFRNLFPDYFKGELKSPEYERLEEHLDTCDKCFFAYADFIAEKVDAGGIPLLKTPTIPSSELFDVFMEPKSKEIVMDIRILTNEDLDNIAILHQGSSYKWEIEDIHIAVLKSFIDVAKTGYDAEGDIKFPDIPSRVTRQLSKDECVFKEKIDGNLIQFSDSPTKQLFYGLSLYRSLGLDYEAITILKKDIEAFSDRIAKQKELSELSLGAWHLITNIYQRASFYAKKQIERQTIKAMVSTLLTIALSIRIRQRTITPALAIMVNIAWRELKANQLSGAIAQQLPQPVRIGTPKRALGPIRGTAPQQLQGTLTTPIDIDDASHFTVSVTTGRELFQIKLSSDKHQIEKVKVWLISPTGDVREGTTDAQGIAYIEDVKAGDYAMVIEQPKEKNAR